MLSRRGQGFTLRLVTLRHKSLKALEYKLYMKVSRFAMSIDLLPPSVNISLHCGGHGTESGVCRSNLYSLHSLLEQSVF